MPGSPQDSFNLARFEEAQSGRYEQALTELRRGRKSSHWIWFVFPQLSGLGLSSASKFYGIENLAEARAYVAHPVLGPRLIECVETLLCLPCVSAAEVLGELDALKLRSCLTLFDVATREVPSFRRALSRFFEGVADEKTLRLLALHR